ncbi:MAG: hypothetical protein WDO74_01660 [Pseudomonadota bacterium]
MVKLDFVVTHVGEAFLANVIVSSNNLKHHRPRDVPPIATWFSGFSRGTLRKENGANMAPNSTTNVLVFATFNRLPVVWIAVQEEVDCVERFCASLDCPELRKGTLVRCLLFARFARFAAKEREILDELPVGTVLQFPARLTH